MAKNPKNYFPLWFKKLEELAAVNNFVIDVKFKQSYLEYFDDGYTPEETLDEEMDRVKKGKT